MSTSPRHLNNQNPKGACCSIVRKSIFPGKVLPVLKTVLGCLFIILAVLKIIQRCRWIWELPYPLSTDAYYYLHEMSNRLVSGQGYYTNFSPFFWWCTLPGKLLSLSELEIFNLTICTGILVLSFSLGYLVFSRQDWWRTPAMIYLIWASDILFYRHYAFLKQGTAVAVLFLGTALLLNASFKSKRTAYCFKAAGIVLFVLAGLFHVFAALLVPLFLLSSESSLKLKRSWKIGAVCVLAAAAVFFVSGHVGRIFETTVFRFEWGWQSACKYTQCSSVEWMEMTAYCLFAFVFIGYGIWLRISSSFFWLIWFMYLFLNLPIWNLADHMSHRLALSSVWLCFLGCAVTFRIKTAAKNPPSNIIFLVFSLFLLIISWVCSSRIYTGPPMAVELIANNREVLKKWIPEDSFVLARHGLQFRITYFLNRSSAKEFPENSDYAHYFELRKTKRKKKRCELLNSETRVISDAAECIALSNKWALFKIRGLKSG
jgi:hypothetical protein